MREHSRGQYLVALAALAVCLSVMLSTSGAATPIVRHVTNTTELLSAVAALPVDGGTINMDPGVYQISSTITIANMCYVNLVGSGANTIIRRTGDGDALVFTNVWYGSLHDLCVDSTGTTSGSGIRFTTGCSGCLVDSCRVTNFPASGISFEGSWTYPMYTNRLYASELSGNKGLQLYMYVNYDFYIGRCKFLGNGANPASGATIDASYGGLCILNNFSGNTVGMRLTYGSSQNRIENNCFGECSQEGLILGTTGSAGSWRTIITGNNFQTNSMATLGGYPAAHIYNSVDVTFTGNAIYSNTPATYKHSYGVKIETDAWNCFVTDNIIRHYTASAVSYSTGYGHIVKDNIQ